MDKGDLYKEAEECRRKALGYLGRPEAPFLLRVARQFERVAEERKIRGRDDNDDAGTPGGISS